MRITRAAKVAAFPLTALILVALVACQGPVGPSGPSGPSGPPVSGPSGPSGPSGVSSLEALNGEGHANTVVADYVDNTAAGEIGALMPIDVSDYFRGGKGDLTFKITGMPPAMSTFEVSQIAAGSTMTTVKIRTAGTTTAKATHDYALPIVELEGTNEGNFNPTESETTYFTVTATDADMFTAMKTLAVLANRKPVANSDDWNMDANDVAILVGTQDAKDTARDGGAMDARTNKTYFVCKTFKVCALTPTVVAWNAVPADLMDGDDFGDDLHGADRKLTYSFVPGRAPLPAVSVVGDGKITLTGLKSTYNATDMAHVPVMVTIRAMDKGGLYVDRQLAISVDGEPTKETGLPTSKTVKVDADGDGTDDTGLRILVGSVGNFFKDPEGAAPTLTGKSTNPRLASVVDTGGNADDGIQVGADLEINAINTGSVTITVTATDTLGQSISHDISVTIE